MVVSEPGHATRTLRVSAGLTIGRSQTCAVRVFDTQTSKRHFTITDINSELHIVDTGSTNGFDVEGGPECHAGDTQVLKSGLVIRVGDLRIMFRVSSSVSGTASRDLEPLDQDSFSASISASVMSMSGSGVHTRGMEGDQVEREIALFTFAQAARPRLLVSTEGRCHISALNQAEIGIGRARQDKNPVVIEDDTVSNFHAKINFLSTHFYLKDLGSKNHTFAWVGRRREMLTKNIPREILPKTRLAFGSVNALFLANLDSERRDVSYADFDVALVILQERGSLDKKQVDAATEKAGDGSLHRAEVLLEEGDASFEDFIQALEKARERLDPHARPQNRMTNILLAALLLVFIAIAAILAWKL